MPWTSHGQNRSHWKVKEVVTMCKNTIEVKTTNNSKGVEVCVIVLDVSDNLVGVLTLNQ